MNNSNISLKVEKELDRLVERVARKAGYSAGEETYKEHLKNKFEELKTQWKQEGKKYRHKFGLKSSQNPDFAEEIKTYLKDGILDLMVAGYSEEEALKMTVEKFDEAELQENFSDFMKEFEDFGMEEYEMEVKQWYAKNGEVIGLFYGAFTTLGMTIGAFIGFVTGGGVSGFLETGWIQTLIGLFMGIMFGSGLGLVSHAFIVIKRK